MKIIWRTLIILAAAMMVVGGAFALSHTSAATQLGVGERFPGGPPPNFAPDGFNRDQSTGNFPERGFGEGDGRFPNREGAGSLFNLGGLLRNLGIITIIFLVVALIDILIGRIRRRRKATV